MKTSNGWQITYTSQGDHAQFNAYKDGFGVAHKELNGLIALTHAIDLEAGTTTGKRYVVQDNIDRHTFERLWEEYVADEIDDYDYFRLCQLARKFNIKLTIINK